MALLDCMQRNASYINLCLGPGGREVSGSKWLLPPHLLHFERILTQKEQVYHYKKLDFSTTPSWVVRLDDDEDEEDAEFFGVPAFESKLAPAGYKETTRHNPRAIHKNFGKHVLESIVNLTIKKKNRCLQILKGH
nr:hypothetical protein CFP56_47926 [Quercus suber]